MMTYNDARKILTQEPASTYEKIAILRYLGMITAENSTCGNCHRRGCIDIDSSMTIFDCVKNIVVTRCSHCGTRTKLLFPKLFTNVAPEEVIGERHTA